MGAREIGPSHDQRKLTLAVIESMKNRGMSQSDIAREFGVTRQAVSWHKHHYGGEVIATRDGVGALPVGVVG